MLKDPARGPQHLCRVEKVTEAKAHSRIAARSETGKQDVVRDGSEDARRSQATAEVTRSENHPSSANHLSPEPGDANPGISTLV